MMILLLQEQPSPAWVKEYGWPAATLFVVLIGFILLVRWLARTVWPEIRDYIISLRKEAQEAHGLVKDLLEKAEDRANVKSQEFLSALEKQREASIAGMKQQGEIYSKALEVHTEKLTGLIGEQTVAIKSVKDAVDTVSAKMRKEG